MGSHAATGRCVFACAAFLTVAAAAVTSLPAAASKVYYLGPLPGGLQAEAFKLNDAGQAVGYSLTNGTDFGTLHTVRWDWAPGTGGTTVDLTALSSTADGLGQIAGAPDINSSGQFPTSTRTLVGNQLAYAGARYTGTPGSGGTMEILGQYIVAQAINDTGDITGYYYQSGFAPQAIRYTGTAGAGGAAVFLGTLGGTQSYGVGINNAGQVAGYAPMVGDSGSFRAFLYTGTPGAGGVMHNLGTLGTGDSSQADAINNAGQVVGSSTTEIDPDPNDANFPPRRGFLYTGTPGAGGAMIALAPASGGDYSAAWGINDAGFVVGASTPGATLWLNDPAHTPVDLNAWLLANDPAAAAKWDLRSAYDINSNGLIVGTGAYNDGPGGLSDGLLPFMLDAAALVPEPTGALLIPTAAAALLARRRRGRRGP